MKLDIKKALLSPFSDLKWHVKITLPCLVISLLFILYNVFPENSLYVLIVFLIISLVILTILGYFVEFAHGHINDDNFTLPNWRFNFFKYFKNGFAIIILFLLYLILDTTFANSIFIPNIILIVFKWMFLLLFIFSFCTYSDKYKFKSSLNLFRQIDLLLNSINKLIIPFVIIWGLYILILKIRYLGAFDIWVLPLISIIIWQILLNLFCQSYKVAKQKIDINTLNNKKITKVLSTIIGCFILINVFLDIVAFMLGYIIKNSIGVS